MILGRAETSVRSATQPRPAMCPSLKRRSTPPMTDINKKLQKRVTKPNTELKLKGAAFRMMARTGQAPDARLLPRVTGAAPGPQYCPPGSGRGRLQHPGGTCRTSLRGQGRNHCGGRKGWWSPSPVSQLGNLRPPGGRQQVPCGECTQAGKRQRDNARSRRGSRKQVAHAADDTRIWTVGPLSHGPGPEHTDHCPGGSHVGGRQD